MKWRLLVPVWMLCAGVRLGCEGGESVASAASAIVDAGLPPPPDAHQLPEGGSLHPSDASLVPDGGPVPDGALPPIVDAAIPDGLPQPARRSTS